MKKIVLVVGVLILIVVVRGCMERDSLKPAVPESTLKISMTIPEGSSLRSIAHLLEDEGVIRSAGAFEALARRQKLAGKMQAGSFLLSPSMTAEEVLLALTSAEQENIAVTIPEGFTVADIDQLMTEKGFAAAGALMTCAQSCDFSAFAFLPKSSDLASRGGALEGYLFPDTYFVARQNFSAQEFLSRLLSTFQAKVIDAHASEIAASEHSLHDIVTMASLIEEETVSDGERGVVSGILWKRLREGMRLDVDAAVRYILDKPSSAITQQDLQFDSPYNLRRHGGLPPGPIANPGLKSIEAALNPEESAYYYYLHDPQGQIHYAKTNDEQNANRARYLR